MQLQSKPVPAELTMSGICEANVLIWLQFRQIFLMLAQLNALSSPIRKSLMKLELEHPDIYSEPSST
jgi:hypothetical protein